MSQTRCAAIVDQVVKFKMQRARDGAYFPCHFIRLPVNLSDALSRAVLNEMREFPLVFILLIFLQKLHTFMNHNNLMTPRVLLSLKCRFL